MRSAVVLTSLLAVASVVAGCKDSTSPRDLVAPAEPRTLVSVTGDEVVYLSWVDNTESDLAGYRVYEASCGTGSGCPYEVLGVTTDNQFTVTGLANGETRYFAVTAFDRAGNESELSGESTHEVVFDTPRPEGFDQAITDAALTPATSGWDFSAYAVRAYDDAAVDVYYTRSGDVDRMIAPFVDTDIQDAGYAATLDAIDFAPMSGWAPSGAVEIVVGHCYLVRTFDDHYAKFRVTSLGVGHLVMDWAYQVDPGNRELKARRTNGEGARVRRALTFAAAR